MQRPRAVQVQIVHHEMNRPRVGISTGDPLQGRDETGRGPVRGGVREMSAGLRLDDAVDVGGAMV